ncbi:unnamed protein product [Linum trigynum]|uniref:Uncharacterized protein n=1 Tax=Linum trigynum TaxID=586398 RepID=A0AAV2G6S4_9ROSI
MHSGTWVIQSATTKRNAQPATPPEGQGLAQNTPPRRQSEILKPHSGTRVIQNATTKRNAQPAIRPEGQGLAQNTPPRRQSEILKRIPGHGSFNMLPRSGMPNPEYALRGRDSLITRHPEGRARS